MPTLLAICQKSGRYNAFHAHGNTRKFVTQWIATVSLFALLCSGEMALANLTHLELYSTGTNSVPEDVLTTDLDSDGDKDLVVPNSGTDSITVLLNTGNGSYSAPIDYSVGTTPLAVAEGNFDNNGDLDIVVANSASNNVSVMMNNGDATFAAAVNYNVATAPVSVQVGDFDGVNGDDIAVVNRDSNNISILLNNGDGTFAAAVNYATGTSPRALAVGDLDGVNGPDLVTANFSTNNFSIFLSNGDGTFATAVNKNTNVGPSSIALADLNGATGLDVVVGSESGTTASIFFNNGDGTFGAINNYAWTKVLRIALGDIDGVNGPDLIGLPVTAAFSHLIYIALNNGDGTFATSYSMPVGDRVSGLRIDDLDGSAGLDIAVANRTSKDVAVLLNQGNGRFYSASFLESYGSAYSGVSVDVDNANGKDLIVTSPTMGQLYVSLNNGDGTLAPKVGYPVATEGGSIAYADLDADNFVDLITPSIANSNVSVFINNGDGTFATKVDYTVPGGSPVHVAVADIDGTNGNDIVVSIDATSDNLAILYNNGDGTFSSAVSLSLSRPVKRSVLEDFNQDGLVDILINMDIYVVLLLNNGDGSFSAGEIIYALDVPEGISSIDLDNANGPDLVAIHSTLSNASSDSISYCLNDGNGGFSCANELLSSYPISLHVGDIDGIHGDDVIVGQYNEIAIFHHDGVSGLVKATQFTQYPSVFPSNNSITLLDLDNAFGPDLIYFESNNAVLLYNNTDWVPDSFNFTSVSNAALSTVLSSNPITVSGLGAPAKISINNGEYSINGGTFTSATGTISDNDTVRVRLTSASTYLSNSVATLTIGGVSGTFDVQTKIDNDPDRISFAPVTEADLSTVYTTEVATVTGLAVSTTLKITNGEYSLNGGAFTSTDGMISNNDTIQLRVTSAATYLTNTNATLKIGSTVMNYTVSTLSDTPASFSFTDQSNVPLSTTIASDSISLSGLQGSARITIENGYFSINGGARRNAESTLSNGDVLVVYARSQDTYSASTDVIVHIGSLSDTFTVTTIGEDNSQTLEAGNNTKTRFGAIDAYLCLFLLLFVPLLRVASQQTRLRGQH